MTSSHPGALAHQPASRTSTSGFHHIDELRNVGGMVDIEGPTAAIDHNATCASPSSQGDHGVRTHALGQRIRHDGHGVVRIPNRTRVFGTSTGHGDATPAIGERSTQGAGEQLRAHQQQHIGGVK